MLSSRATFLLSRGLARRAAASSHLLGAGRGAAPAVRAWRAFAAGAGDAPEHQVLTMPALSPTMEEGKLVAWRVDVGGEVKAGEPVADIETDKATVEMEAAEDGWLAKQLVSDDGDDMVRVGAPIALVATNKADIDAVAKLDPPAQSGSSAAKEVEEPAAGTGDGAAAEGGSAAAEAPASGGGGGGGGGSDLLANAPPHTLLRMPALSPTMEEGTLGAWTVSEGGRISAGEPIAEVETDKASVEWEAAEDGWLAAVLPTGAAGKQVKVGDVVAVAADSEDDVEALKELAEQGAFAAEAGGGGGGAKGAGKGEAAPAAASKVEEEPAAAAPAPSSQQAPSAPSGTGRDGDRVRASPYARKLARGAGFSVGDLAPGSGPHGRVVAADVAKAEREGAPAGKAAGDKSSAAAAAAAAAPALPPRLEAHSVKHSPLRKAGARTLERSNTEVPAFYLFKDIDCTRATRFLRRLREESGVKLSLNDVVIAAAARAMPAAPFVNSSWHEDRIEVHGNVHVNVAVATDKGLVAPIIRDADRIGLAAINARVRDVAERARGKGLPPADLDVGTFTVSNLGGMGVDRFTAIIIPPQSCILAVGKANKDGVVTVSLGCDHRSVDGAVGAVWLQEFARLMEDPARMLL